MPTTLLPLPPSDFQSFCHPCRPPGFNHHILYVFSPMRASKMHNFHHCLLLLLYTLYNVILRIARNLLETRKNIKIESHSFCHMICDWLSWGWSIVLKFQNCFSTPPILNIFFQKFHGLVLGLVGLIDWCSSNFFAWSPWKSVTYYVIEWMGLNFDVFPCFQQIPYYA